jgi:hypothetical protein
MKNTSPDVASSPGKRSRTVTTNRSYLSPHKIGTNSLPSQINSSRLVHNESIKSGAGTLTPHYMTQISGAAGGGGGGQAGAKVIPVNNNFGSAIDDLNRDLMVHFQQDSHQSQYPLLSY